MSKSGSMPRRVLTVALSACMATSTMPVQALAEVAETMRGGDSEVIESAVSAVEAEAVGGDDAADAVGNGAEGGASADGSAAEGDASPGGGSGDSGSDASSADELGDGKDAPADANDSDGAGEGPGPGNEANDASPVEGPGVTNDMHEQNPGSEGLDTVSAPDAVQDGAEDDVDSGVASVDSFIYQVNSDESTCTITGYTGAAGELDIPETISGYAVTGIGEQAFKGGQFSSVSIPSGVSSIGEGAFDGCNLTRMGLASWDIYNSVVGSEAGFNYGDHLVYYVSPRNLDGIVFGPGEDTGFGIAAKNPEDVRQAWCTVTVGGATIKADLVYGDDGCWHLYVDLSWGGGGDCNVGAFVYQDASGNETEISTTGFFSAFGFQYADNGDGTCTVTGALGRQADLVIPAEIGSLKVAAIGDAAFNGASWVETLELPEGLASIGESSFKGCTSLRSLSLPSTLSSIGMQAFDCCEALGFLTVCEGIASLGAEAFRGCTSLRGISFPSSLREIGFNCFSGCSALESVVLPEGLQTLSPRAFEGCSSLKSVTLPTSLASVGFNSLSGLAQGSTIYVPTWDLFYMLDGNGICLNLGSTSVVYTGTDPEPAISFQILANGDGTCAVTGARGRAADLVIPTEIDGRTVTEISDRAFRGAAWIETLELPESLVSIGESAFSGCTSLRSLSLPGGLASIGDYAFWGCSSLVSLSMCEGVRSLGDYAFSECGALESVSLPGSLDYVGRYSFESCTSLESLTINEGVTSLGTDAFRGCAALRKVSLPTTLLWIWGGCFWGCSALESVILPEGLQTLDSGAFLGCSSLKSVTLPASLSSVGDRALAELAPGGTVCVPTWDLFYMLDGNGNYISPDCTSVVYTGSDPEPEMSFLISDNNDGTCTVTGVRGRAADLSIPSDIDGLKVTAIGSYAFKNASWIEALELPEGLVSVGDGAFEGCLSLASLVMHEGVCALGAHSFYNCSSLSSVTLPASLVSVGAQALGSLAEGSTVYAPTWDLFYQLDDGRIDPDRTSVVYTGTDPEPEPSAIRFRISTYPDGTCTVTGVDGTAADLVIPAEIDGYRVTAIGNGAFADASWIKTLVLPEGLVTIQGQAFRFCSSMQSVSLPSTLETIESIAFWCCSSLVSVSLPGSLRSMESNVFSGCTSLEFLTVEEGVTSLAEDTFSQCASLREVSLPSSLQTIGGRCFALCSALESIVLPEGLQTLEFDAFDGCSSLKSVVLPGSLSVIGDNAFSNLAEGSTVYAPTWGLYNRLAGSSAYISADKTTVAYSGPATIYGTSLTLEGSIGLNLYVAIPDDVAGLEGACAEIVGPNGRQAIPLSGAVRKGSFNGVPVYAFTTELYAKNMADVLAFRIIGGDGAALPLVTRKDESSEIDAFAYSVKAYCDVAQSDGSEALGRLAEATANFGAAAQLYFGYGTGSLAGDAGSGAISAVSADDLAVYESGGFDGGVSGLAYVGSTLTLESATTVSHYFSVDARHSIGDYVFEVNGVAVTPVRKGSYWRIQVANIPAQRLEEAHTVTVSCVDGSNAASMDYSAMSYAYLVLSKKPSEGLVTLCKALYVYNQAANQYFDGAD